MRLKFKNTLFLRAVEGIITLLFISITLSLYGCQQKKEENFDKKINKIKHVVVIYMENHSFDNLYGQFEGANGLSSAKEENIIQVDKNGRPYDTLPPIPRSGAIPSNLPNSYFNIDQYISNDKISPGAIHQYYQEIMQIDSGKMNKFVLYNPTKAMTMGYYTTKLIPLYRYAKKYTLCDNFFHSGFGGSYFNHIFLIASAPAEWPDAPEEIVAEVDSTGRMVKNDLITPDGYAVNTIFPENPWHPEVDSSRLLPPQTLPTIGDRLSEKGVSWAWYAQGWDNAIAGNRDVYVASHAPFTYFAKYAPGTEGRKHLKDENDFLEAANAGTLPSVSFVKPGLGFDEHPGIAPVYLSENHAIKLIDAVLDGPNGKDALVILTYDENGGFWDHVVPPVIDRWGPGTRVPAIVKIGRAHV